MSSTLPVLYSFRRCPYAIRARLALAASGVIYQLREVSLKDKPAEMLAVSPKGEVPVLVLPGGEVIDESLDIMRWALGINDPALWLQQGLLQDALALVAGNDGMFKHALDRYKYPHRYLNETGDGVPAFTLAHRMEAARWLQILEMHLSKGWLFGGQAGLADMACLPFVRQFAHTDTAWFSAQPWPKLQVWLANFEVSALFEGVMKKQRPWQVST